jgi:hypothetical protein
MPERQGIHKGRAMMCCCSGLGKHIFYLIKQPKARKNMFSRVLPVNMQKFFKSTGNFTHGLLFVL